MDEKAAIGITSLAEGLVCVVDLTAYVLPGNGGMSWELSPSLILGAVPLAAFTVKKIPVNKMRWAIGSAVTALGLFTLIKLVL